MIIFTLHTAHVRQTWPMAMSSQPDIVTIMLGTNDGKYFNWEGVQQDLGDYYALDYVDMINQLRTLEPQPEIFVMIPPPLYEPYPFKMNKTVINDIYPTLIRDIASVMRVQVIDIHSRFLEYNQLQPLTNLTCDGCHPTVEGVVIIADAVRDAILSSYKTIQEVNANK
jgi:acyl-CoA thioesterase-1